MIEQNPETPNADILRLVFKPNEKGDWTDEEHQRFVEAVLQYGTDSWMQVAIAVGTRKSKKCLKHWN